MIETTAAQKIEEMKQATAWYAREQKKENFALNVVFGLVFTPMLGTLAYVASRCFL